MGVSTARTDMGLTTNVLQDENEVDDDGTERKRVCLIYATRC